MDTQHTGEAETLYHQAVDRMADGDIEGAIEGFRHSLASDPAFADASHGLIHALKHAKRYDEAVEVAQSLIAADPDDVLAHTSLSILYQHQGRIPEAEAESTKAKVLGWKLELRAARDSESK
ncbi:tetratricopeptide repeat protein [Silvibacterium acidisoli]|uniref:tetratricopeptide repeat protein n=1 Tax=Acidobacteriaceae bacterium ZG23-2 TaxID=2883246 RepID=UPI00406C1BA1